MTDVYTAINTGGHGLRDQRIGMVESDDLFTWRRTMPQPVVSPDTRWYRTLELLDPIPVVVDAGYGGLVATA